MKVGFVVHAHFSAFGGSQKAATFVVYRYPVRFSKFIASLELLLVGFLGTAPNLFCSDFDFDRSHIIQQPLICGSFFSIVDASMSLQKFVILTSFCMNVI